ncbi:DUF5133 domain-containing protein [Streptomyces sp. NBC_01744]|uniref:DUF5133 domain-containing protein n=1 Tax=Streptomyces sp. NBC_01744 TaxID=2975927 RepID=UPI003D9A1404|nr:DUF5133 domain-containing protein [Streptomyces sp. NBC_01744]
MSSRNARRSAVRPPPSEYLTPPAYRRDHEPSPPDDNTKTSVGDVAYTLCVATGTGDIDSALVAARYQLPGARPQDDSLLAAGPVNLPSGAITGILR